MRALLLIAHGSRREASNDEVRALAAKMAEHAGLDFGIVVPAFLELAEPSIPGGADKCAQAGATEIVAVPYFLSAGRHVAEDIPAELEQARQNNPSVTIRQSDYLGKHADVLAILLALANA